MARKRLQLKRNNEKLGHLIAEFHSEVDSLSELLYNAKYRRAEAALELYKRGVSVSEIGLQCGVSRNAVYQWWRAFNLEWESVTRRNGE